MTRRGNTKVNVDEIPAGWGIDGLIAQRFLGWTKGEPVFDVPHTWKWHAPDGKVYLQPPKLSEDLNLAMEVVEALFELGWKFGITQNSDKEVVVMFVPKTEGYDPMKAVKAKLVSVKLAALGICRAALLVAERLHDKQKIELPVM